MKAPHGSNRQPKNSDWKQHFASRLGPKTINWTCRRFLRKSYLRAKAENQIVLNEAKLILIGEGEVRKTSLLGALWGDKWVENRPKTHGVEVKIKSLVLDVPSVAGSLREPAASPDGEADGARKDREGSRAGSRSEPATKGLHEVKALVETKREGISKVPHMSG